MVDELHNKEILSNICCYLATDDSLKFLWCKHRMFQTRASLGIARVTIVLIAYHYIVLQDDGAEPSDSKGQQTSLKLDG